MKVPLKLAACVAAAALAAGCGDQPGADGLTADQRERLNQQAEQLDANDIVDASPDSLVANDEWMAAETGETATDVNAGAAPAANAAAANGQ
jgi:hypothetical protein